MCNASRPDQSYHQRKPDQHIGTAINQTGLQHKYIHTYNVQSTKFLFKNSGQQRRLDYCSSVFCLLLHYMHSGFDAVVS